MNKNYLMVEDVEAAARSRANVARRRNEGEDCPYNRSTPDSRYELPLVITRGKTLRSILMLIGRWTP